MTKEQEEIIKKNRTILLDLINYIRFDEEKHYTEGEYYKAIEELNEKSVDLLNTVEKQRTEIETKDRMLKEKDRLLARNVAKNFTFSIKEAEKAKEDLEMLNRGWQIELEKKDKIIDLMTEEIAENMLNTCPQADYNCDLDCENRCNDDYKRCWKQYFEKRVEECGR